MSEPVRLLTKKDFASDQEVRWCPGCGDYAVLSAMQRALAETDATLEKTVFISGIGCSSRFPFYMSTYGFHTIHGRAPAVATGLKLTRPELDVWVITGDGDALSIGGNHFIHAIRRNVNLQIILFNNQIYGLTKGQYSPTSAVGKVTPSSPVGSVDAPLSPVRVALGANAKFVARGYDVSKDLHKILKEARAFDGTAFVEILQNCPVFNDGVFDALTDRTTGPSLQLWLEHGKPMILADKKHGVRLNLATLALEVVPLGDGITEEHLLVHDETNPTLAWLLSEMGDVKALGVIYRESGAAAYDSAVRGQLSQVPAGLEQVNKLLRSGHTWRVS